MLSMWGTQVLMRSCGRHLKFPRPFPIYLEESHSRVMNIARLWRGALVWLLRNQIKGFKGERRCNRNEWKYNLQHQWTLIDNWKRLCSCMVDKIIFSFLLICPRQINLESFNYDLDVNYVSIHKSSQRYVCIIQGNQQLRNYFREKLS